MKNLFSVISVRLDRQCYVEVTVNVRKTKELGYNLITSEKQRLFASLRQRSLILHAEHDGR